MSESKINFLSEQVAMRSSLVAASSDLSVKLAEALEKGDMKEFDELRRAAEDFKTQREALTFSIYLRKKN